jgi:hypothetical protein
MKKIFILILSLFLIAVAKPAFPQAGSISIGLVATDCDQIILTWTSSFSFVGTGSNAWSQSTVTLSWPSALGANVMGAGNTTNLTSILPGFTGWQFNGAANLVGGEYRRELILLNGGYVQDIPIGTTEIVAIKLDGAGTGSFTLIDPNLNTDISNLNYAVVIWTGTFTPATVSGVPLADAIRWNGTRWCGGKSTTYFGEPSSLDQAVNCFITGANGVLHTVDARANQLTVNAACNLTIAVGASFTTYGAVNISGVNGLNVAADATGTGSYISRNATFNYLGSGNSTVSQYFTDNVTFVPVHTHLVGPLVNDPAFQTANGFQGVYLNAFNLVGGSTYAYVYDNTLVGTEWVNVSAPTYLVPTTLGLALSTTSNNSMTYSMTGKMISGNFNTNNGNTLVNTGLNLISNPYPSGLNLFAFLDLNYATNADLGADVWAWEGANVTNGGNYSNYNYDADLGTGGLASKVIRIGQGFFVDFLGNGNGYATFSNVAMRTHSNAILLKSEPVDVLRLYVKGNSFSDESIIHFQANGASTYGFADSEKWPSMYENATEAWTVSSDNMNLAINTLEPLTTDLVSVPLNFKCGADDNYTIEAADIETFEPGTEIWLEDLKIGGDWINLVQNPVYEFSGSQSDLQERFIVHFFGPTAIEDNPQDEVKSIQIYGWQHDAYIVNRGTETIKEYIAYDMMGRELHRGTLPNSTVNKVTIGDASAYYIVKVITKEGNVYTGKVYITK